MEWKSAESGDTGQTKIPKRWLLLHYYEALNILFRFENSLRVFVYAILKSEFHEKWSDCSFGGAGAEQKTIKSVAARRVSQAENFGYLGYDIQAPLMHLTSGELVELITSEAYWPRFRPHFRGSKEIIKNKLLEIGTIRNSLAHFRPISADDIELIKQNSKHTLIEVENCLQGVFSQPGRVPTNTKDSWYESIRTLGTEQIATASFHSADEQWVNIKLSFTAPQLEKQRFGQTYFDYSMTKLNTAAIVVSHELLRRYVTYITEWLNYPQLTKEFDLVVKKDVNVVFKKEVLVANSEVIAKELSAVLGRIAEECDLLRRDNLARGEFIEVVRAWAYWSEPEGAEGSWKFNTSALLQSYESTHPDEYWGQSQFSGDVIGGLRRYPWMPADISQADDLWD
jgi:hypothetical protein